mmetsp:Transcript_79963/g.193658  ORF Transcript_79963/g.193658 Transcript_79963/m.193658 type:complete len:227 (+) Transcript_79963:12-692(+)
MACARVALVLACAASAAGFCAVPLGRHSPACVARAAARTELVTMQKKFLSRGSFRKWEKQETAAPAVDLSSGIVGTIPVEFSHGNESITTMAFVGQELSAVAAQSGQYIKYQCKKGACGTCEVRVDGKWIRTCVSQVPYVDPGQTYKVQVKSSMKKAKSASGFYSFRSIFAGMKNNIVGMFGFLREGRKSQSRFEERIGGEDELMKLVAKKKAAKAAAAAAGLKSR